MDQFTVDPLSCLAHTMCVARPVPGPSQAKMTADESIHLPCTHLHVVLTAAMYQNVTGWNVAAAVPN